MIYSKTSGGLMHSDNPLKHRWAHFSDSPAKAINRDPDRLGPVSQFPYRCPATKVERKIGESRVLHDKNFT